MSNPDLLIYALHAGFRGAFGLAIAITARQRPPTPHQHSRP